MIFVAVGVFILGCVVGWFVRQASLIELEIVFDDGSKVEGYYKRTVEAEDEE